MCYDVHIVQRVLLHRKHTSATTRELCSVPLTYTRPPLQVWFSVGPTHLLRARAASHKRVLGPQLWPERVGLEEGHSVAVPVERRHERVVAVGVLVRVLKRAPVHLPDTM